MGPRSIDLDRNGACRPALKAIKALSSSLTAPEILRSYNNKYKDFQALSSSLKLSTTLSLNLLAVPFSVQWLLLCSHSSPCSASVLMFPQGRYLRLCRCASLLPFPYALQRRALRCLRHQHLTTPFIAYKLLYTPILVHTHHIVAIPFGFAYTRALSGSIFGFMSRPVATAFLVLHQTANHVLTGHSTRN